MRFHETELPGVILVEPLVHRDGRGFFLETYRTSLFAEGGIDVTFVQDNHSHSARGTLRGLHMQLRRPQGKLVKAIVGEIFDVAVDARPGSPSFGQWAGARLSGDNFRQLYIPPGFLHGFCVLSETADVEYKCTEYYDPESDISVAWNDPDIGIEWPVSEPILSPKDARASLLTEIMDQLPTAKDV